MSGESPIRRTKYGSAVIIAGSRSESREAQKISQEGELPFHGMRTAAPRSVKMPLTVDPESCWTGGRRATSSTVGFFDAPVFDVEVCAVASESVP